MDIDIRARLSCVPKPKKHEILVITRGATAALNFPLFDKVYSMDNIEQITFSFKQGKNLFYWNMIEYYELTTDVVAKTDTIYYTRIDRNVPSQSPHKFVATPKTPGESVSGLYERSDLPNGQDPVNWQFDSHFVYHNEVPGAEYVSFCFTSEETKLFKPTQPDCNVIFEIAVRLDTDDTIYQLNGNDSIIIVPQHPIAVVDSLYSKVGE